MCSRQAKYLDRLGLQKYIGLIEYNTIQSVICIAPLYNLSRSANNKTMRKTVNKMILSAV